MEKTNKAVIAKAPATERDDDLIGQEAKVFLFMLTRLHPDGTFRDSDQYVANTVMQGNRKKVYRTVERLIAKKCVDVVEESRRDPARGDLPAVLRPVSPHPIWSGKRGRLPTQFVTTGVSDIHDHPTEQVQVAKASATSHVPAEGSVTTGGTESHSHNSSITSSSTQWSVDIGNVDSDSNCGPVTTPLHSKSLAAIRAALKEERDELASWERIGKTKNA